MSKRHDFTSRICWTGNRGTGTSAYTAYDRNWEMTVEGKQTVHCSNDPMLGGDASKYNPEELLITALSSCHMLWYLHLCSTKGVIVHAYEDRPVGIGESEPSGKGRFVEAILRPDIIISAHSDIETASRLHGEIHELCFIARSVNFPVRIEAAIRSDQ